MAACNKISILTRQLSTSAISGQMVKAPLQVFGLEGRYATALYSAASKNKNLEQVEKELSAWQETLKTNVALRDFVFSPIINRKVMSNVLKETVAHLKMSPTTSNFLQLLADNGRLKKMDSVVNSFRAIMAAHRGDVVCEVVSAKPLEDGQRKQLENALKAFLKPNESLKVTSRVDPSIIGGLIVSIGDKYVDMSIASKVKMYTEVISTAA